MPPTHKVKMVTAKERMSALSCLLREQHKRGRRGHVILVAGSSAAATEMHQQLRKKFQSALYTGLHANEGLARFREGKRLVLVVSDTLPIQGAGERILIYVNPPLSTERYMAVEAWCSSHPQLLEVHHFLEVRKGTRIADDMHHQNDRYICDLYTHMQATAMFIPSWLKDLALGSYGREQRRLTALLQQPRLPDMPPAQSEERKRQRQENVQAVESESEQKLQQQLRRLRGEESALRPMKSEEIDDLESEIASSLSRVKAHAAERRKDDQEANKCLICIERERNVVVQPCNHLVMCKECSQRNYENADKCPICRETIVNVITIFRP